MRLIRDGETGWGGGGQGVWRGGKREIIYLSLHCHHQNDSYIKMGGDESRFSVSFIHPPLPRNKLVSGDGKGGR